MSFEAQILGLAGWSGAGKTTLLSRLIPELVAHGISVSTIKRAHHAFDIDRPGKDSYRHRQAGAHEVLVSSQHRFALMREHRGAPEPTLDDLVARLGPVDLILVEGFKFENHEKIEVHRPSVGKPLLCIDDPRIVAVISDAPVPQAAVPVLPLDRIEAIVEFIVRHCGFQDRAA